MLYIQSSDEVYRRSCLLIYPHLTQYFNMEETRIMVVHKDNGSKVAVYDTDTNPPADAVMVSYPKIAIELMQELRYESTTPRRIRDILNQLDNL